jgi:hypothetical protein
MTTGLDFKMLAFFLADHAEALNGKLYVNGGFFNRVRFPMYPAALPPIAIAVVLEVPFGKYQSEHVMVVGLEDQDGEPLPFKVEARFRVGAAAEMHYGDPTVMPLAMPVYGLVLQRPGDYCFTAAVNGDELGRWPFRAEQVVVPMQFNLGPPPPQSEAS